MSDLHLFAGRSDGQVLFSDVLDNADAMQMDTLVLNGDTFDFRWSELESEAISIDAALQWLEELVERLPHATIHFLLGNHDCLQGFVDRLTAWSVGRLNFSWHAMQLQIGDNLFLHGDVANRKMDANALARFRAGWARDRQKGKLSRRLYQIADRSGASLAFHRAWFPPAVTIRRIANHLDQTTPQWRRETSAVYFGHTHCPIDQIEVNGITFHNTGSGIRGMGFSPRWFASHRR